MKSTKSTLDTENDIEQSIRKKIHLDHPTRIAVFGLDTATDFDKNREQLL